MRKSEEKRKWDWRDKLTEIGIILFIAAFFVAYFVDGYVYHSIPAPKDTQMLDSYYEFDLSRSGSEYADATVLYKNPHIEDNCIYMVEKDGEIHLLCYEMHYPTQRRRLADDKIIEPGMTGSVKLFRGRVELVDGEVISSYDSDTSIVKMSYGVCLMIAIAATFVIMLPLSLLAKFLKKREDFG